MRHYTNCDQSPLLIHSHFFLEVISMFPQVVMSEHLEHGSIYIQQV